LDKNGFLSAHREGPKVRLRFGKWEIILDRLSSQAIDDPWLIAKAKTFAAKGASCVYCGKDASQVDHVTPRCQGGTDDLSNLVPACAACNTSKNGRTPEEWLK
jgi:5-methylcytosine-specific restriction endonuclease McrA